MSMTVTLGSAGSSSGLLTPSIRLAMAGPGDRVITRAAVAARAALPKSRGLRLVSNGGFVRVCPGTRRIAPVRVRGGGGMRL